MLATDQIETVLVGTTADPANSARVVIAFRQGTELFVPLEAGRSAYQELLDAEALYVRTTDSLDEYTVYELESHRVISTSDRQRLEAYLHQPISVTTEVFHLTLTHARTATMTAQSASFVAVLDGSERASRALKPAIALAHWYERPLNICVVTAGADDLDTPTAVRFQLDGSGVEASQVASVAKPDLDAQLFDLMRQGHILVASAFGVWAADGRLHGMLNGLVRHNAPALVGVGPNVAHDWAPSATQPIIICVDASDHAHELVEQATPFVRPSRNPIVVVHVATESPPNQTIADEVARQIQDRFGTSTEAKVLVGASVPEALATFVSAVDAQLVIMNSWHRPDDAHPTVQSTSVTSVAHMPCPVAILTSQRVEPRPATTGPSSLPRNQPRVNG